MVFVPLIDIIIGIRPLEMNTVCVICPQKCAGVCIWNPLRVWEIKGMHGGVVAIFQLFYGAIPVICVWQQILASFIWQTWRTNIRNHFMADYLLKKAKPKLQNNNRGRQMNVFRDPGGGEDFSQHLQFDCKASCWYILEFTICHAFNVPFFSCKLEFRRGKTIVSFSFNRGWVFKHSSLASELRQILSKLFYYYNMYFLHNGKGVFLLGELTTMSRWSHQWKKIRRRSLQ